MNRLVYFYCLPVNYTGQLELLVNDIIYTSLIILDHPWWNCLFVLFLNATSRYYDTLLELRNAVYDQNLFQWLNFKEVEI